MTDHPKPFRDLSDAEKGALLLAHHRGRDIEHFSKSREVWIIADSPWWSDETIYRIAPEPLIPDSIDWSHVAPEWNFMARDDDGDTWVFKARPAIDGSDDFWHDQDWAGDATCLAAFASYRRGTVDWKDSLVIRPGHEVKP